MTDSRVSDGFEGVVPYLEANPTLEFHPWDQYGPRPEDWYYAVSGPGPWLPFRVVDATVLAKLDAAARR